MKNVSFLQKYHKMLDFLNSVKDKKYEIIYITGKSYYDAFSKNKFSKNAILEFENEYKKQMNSISDDIKAKRKKVNTLSDKEIIEIEKYGTLLNNKE